MSRDRLHLVVPIDPSQFTLEALLSAVEMAMARAETMATELDLTTVQLNVADELAEPELGLVTVVLSVEGEPR